MFKPNTKENEVTQKISQVDLGNAKEVLKLGREVENSDLWKIYGRESEAGRMLYKLFGKGPASVKIDYPKPKTVAKPLPYEAGKDKPKILPPQKTVIDYPAPKEFANKAPKIHAVDLIPKRKNEIEIRKEIDEFYSKPVIPLNRGVDRKKMIDSLQAKFKKQRGGLPKGAELPLLDPQEEGVLEELTEEELRQKALQKVPKKLLAYTYEKPQEDEKKGLSKEQEEEELEKLYEEIEQEIGERQDYLEEIAHLDEPKLKEKIKKEIVERVAELQKIIQMMRKKN